jgi:voltage-gated potassium channel
VPLTTAGQYFTMALLVSGLGIVFYSTALFARDLLEGELPRVFGRRKVQRQIAQMRDHFIVCGFGRMGRIVCQELAAKPASFVVVDRDTDALQHADGAGYVSLEGDATEDGVLRAAGIERAAGLVAALSTDAANVYVVLTARELNAQLLIVARAEDERSERKLLHAGASRVVSPYVIGGHRMAHALIRPAVLEVIDLATHYRSLELQIEEVLVSSGSFCDGARIGESGIRETLGLIVIAIKKAGGEMLFNPTADSQMAAGDRLVLLGQVTSLREIERRLRAAL